MAENLTMQEYIDEAESELLHTYNRYQIVLDKGDGVYLYDYNGKNTWTLFPALRCLLWDIITKATTMP